MSAWVPPAAGRFLSAFGPRVAPVAGASTWHRGVDIAPPRPGQTGRPVVAVHTGRVIASGYSRVRGYWVIVRHSDGSATRSQHLAGPGMRAGAQVTTGQQIGVMGETGVSKGEHLHFETFDPGANWSSSLNATDPERFMRARGVELRTAVNPNNGHWTPTGLPIMEDDDMQLSDKLPNGLTVGEALSRATYLDAKVSSVLAAATKIETRTTAYLDAKVSEVLAEAKADGTVTVDIDEATIGQAVVDAIARTLAQRLDG
jgi:hypothetical protein